MSYEAASGYNSCATFQLQHPTGSQRTCGSFLSRHTFRSVGGNHQRLQLLLFSSRVVGAASGVSTFEDSVLSASTDSIDKVATRLIFFGCPLQHILLLLRLLRDILHLIDGLSSKNRHGCCFGALGFK